MSDAMFPRHVTWKVNGPRDFRPGIPPPTNHDSPANRIQHRDPPDFTDESRAVAAGFWSSFDFDRILSRCAVLGG